MRLVHLQDDRWRYLNDGLIVSARDGSAKPHFYDRGETSEYGWTLTPDQLLVGDRRGANAPHTADTLNEFKYRVRSHVFQVPVPSEPEERIDIEVLSVSPAEGTFRALYRRTSGRYAGELHGVSDSEGRLHIVSDRTLEHEVPEVIGMITRYSDFEAVGGLPDAARTVETFEPDGTRRSLSHFTSLVSVPAELAEAWTKLPEVGDADPVRGVVRVHAIQDTTSSGIASRISGGAVDNPIHIERAGTRQSESPSYLRWSGWLMLGALAVVFVVMRIRKA